MSLSSIIHDQGAIRDGLRTRLIKPPIRFSAIQAPPLTLNYRIVGTAFDYLLRFLLQRLNSVAQTSRWVAEAGVELIGTSEFEYDLDHNTLSRKLSRQRRKAEKYLAEAKHEHETYLATGAVTENLLIAALRLAYLDVAYRASPELIDWPRVESPNSKDITDLQALLALVNKPTFLATRICLLNPTFGTGSRLVGGADADLVIDDCLIDIKTTKNPYLDIRDFFQLVGYYLLQGFDGIHCTSSKTTVRKINSLAIYFARYGLLWKIAVNEVFPPNSVQDTAQWFFESVCTSKTEQLKYLSAFRGPLSKHLHITAKAVRPKAKIHVASKAK